MEFLHMKDMLQVLNRLMFCPNTNGKKVLDIIKALKMASMNFFFDNINPGVYVFEYDLRVSNRGNFSNGITTILSMYAPEFTSHSEGIRISVK
jgi:hypothetical protein